MLPKRFDDFIHQSGLESSNKIARERLGPNFRVEEIPGTRHKATGYRYNLLENGTVIAQAAHPQSMVGKIEAVAKARGIAPPPPGPTIPAENFCATLSANVSNPKLSDEEFRQFVKNTLPSVIFPRRQQAP